MAGEDMAEEATAEEVDMAEAVTIYFSNYPIILRITFLTMHHILYILVISFLGYL